MKKVAVIILNWNGLSLLQEFLPSICAHTPADIADIVVADNGSTDGSVAWLQENYPDVQRIEFTENYGYAKGYNRAIEQVSHPYVVLLNSDVEVTPGWLSPLLDFCEAHPEVGACQPKLLAYKDKSSFEYAGAAGGFLDKHGYPYCRGRIFSTVEKDNGQYDTPAEIFWATGACLFIRREIYRKAGGLDEHFFAHMEEIDLCWRAKLQGYRIFALPQSRVYHLGGASLSHLHPQKTYLNFRNNLFMLYKNLPLQEGRKIIFRRQWLDTIALLQYLLCGKGRHAYAVWKAHRDFRQQKKMYSEHPEKNLLKEMPEGCHNIVVDYFLRRRHIYQDYSKRGK